MTSQKAEFRSWARGQRQTLNWPGLSQQAVKHLITDIDWTQWPHVVSYMPLPGEMDLKGLYSSQEATLSSINWYLPVIEGNQLLAAHYEPGHTPLQKDKLEVETPIQPDIVLWQEMSSVLLLVPCVAISPGGYRLGRGKGYFDRLLERLEDFAIPFLAVGVCPTALQLGDDWWREVWDAPMDAWLSEAGLNYLETA